MEANSWQALEAEQEISLKDMMFYLLRKAGAVVLAAALGAVVLGGVQAWRTAQAAESARQQYEQQLEEYRQELQTGEQQLQRLQQRREEIAAYLAQSLLMQLDPGQMYCGSAQLYVMPAQGQSLEAGFASALLQAYRAVLAGDAMEQLAADMGVEARYLQELVTVEDRNNGWELTVLVRAATRGQAQQMLDGLMQYAQAAQPGFAAKLGAHALQFVDGGVSAMADSDLAQQQSDRAARVAELDDSIEELSQALAALAQPQPAGTAAMAALRYGAIGALAGAAVAALALCAAFVLRDTVYSAQELESRLRLPVLGALPMQKAKQSRFAAWADRAEQRAADAALGYSMAAASLGGMAAGMHTLLLTGSAPEAVQQAAARLGQALPGLVLVCGGPLAQDAAAVARLAECDGVVLVEQCGLSRYGEELAALKKAAALQKPVLGCIVFE